MKLTNIQCRNAKPKEKPYKLADGKGMFLLIMPTGAKYWRLKYKIHDKEKVFAIGVYPEISLAEAREKRTNAKTLLRKGIDPVFAKREVKRTALLKSKNDFETIAREWHEHNKDRWTPSSGAEVLHRIDKDTFPFIGKALD